MSCVSSFSIKNDDTTSLSDEEDQRVRGKGAKEKYYSAMSSSELLLFLDFYNVHVIFRLLYIP